MPTAPAKTTYPASPFPTPPVEVEAEAEVLKLALALEAVTAVVVEVGTLIVELVVSDLVIEEVEVGVDTLEVPKVEAGVTPVVPSKIAFQIEFSTLKTLKMYDCASVGNFVMSAVRILKTSLGSPSVTVG